MPYSFSLPILTDLTLDQRAVLDETSPVAIKGGPGTGKSVVSLWRHIRNHAIGTRSSLLLTYTKNLELYLSSSARELNATASEEVNRTLWWSINHVNSRYDEIIIDEAQDMKAQTGTVISQRAQMVSFGADDKQSLYDNRLNYNQLRDLYPQTVSYELTRNFRNSREISRFIASMFPTYRIPEGVRNGPKPQIVLSGNSEAKVYEIVRDVIRNFSGPTHNIAVLLPLVRPGLHRQRTVRTYFNQFNNEFDCSMYENEQTGIEEIGSVHFCSFKSAKGLEFDTVIIPEVNFINDDIVDLNIISKRDYYVAFSRAKTNLILIDNGENSDGSCHLAFLQNQIQHRLVEVDDTYVNIPNQGDDLLF